MRIRWAKQLVNIYSRGSQAYHQGLQLQDNPYLRGSGNLQRQRARYWADGWRNEAGLCGYPCVPAIRPTGERP